MRRKNTLALAYFSFLSLTVGESTFLVQDESYDLSDSDYSSTTPVCYNKSTSIYYTSIEKALNSASSGQTIYVIPGSNPTIKKDCTIASGVTLTLPHGVDLSTSYDSSTKKLTLVETESIEKWHDRDDDLPLYNSSASKATTYNNKSLAYSIAKYEKLKVTISDGVTLTNNGTLNIGGILSGGSGSGKYAGHTAYYHAKIYLEGSAKINSNGTLYCYGYIFGDGNKKSTVSFGSSSTSYAPFIVREHRGGTAFLGWNQSSKTTTPFNRFFVCSFINTNYAFFGGAILNGLCDLYASNRHNTTSIVLIGSSSKSGLVNLNSESSFTGYLDKSTQINYVNTYGGFTLKPLSMKIDVGFSLTISTEGLLFPLSWYYDITLNNISGSSSECTIDCTNQDLKILPGASITINKGVKVNIAKLAIYDQEDSNKWTDTNTKWTSSDGNTSYTPGNGYVYGKDTINGVSAIDIPGKLTVNGSLNVTDSLGGSVYTNDSNANLTIANNNLTSDEITGISGKDSYAVVKYGVIATTSYSFSAKTKVFSSLTVGDSTSNINSNMSYISASDSNSNIGFGTTSDSLLIDGVSTITYKEGATTNYSLSTNTLIGNKVVWSSSNTSVATISGSMLNATLTTLGVGNVTITASVYNDSELVQSISKDITIEEAGIPVTAITLNPDDTSSFIDSDGKLSIGDYVNLNASVEPSDAKNKTLSYSSNNSDVASVDSTGKVTMKGTGSAYITVSSTDGTNISKTYTVNVNSNVRVESFTLSSNSLTYTRTNSSGSETAGTVTINPTPNTATINKDNIRLSISSEAKSLDSSISDFTITIISTDNSKVENAKCTVSISNGVNGTTLTKPFSVSVTAEEQDKCVVEGTLISMADGSYKKVEDICSDDEVLVFNHENGKLESSKVIFNDCEELDYYKVIYCEFSNGSKVGVVSEHGFFSLEENKYVYIKEDNYLDYIGKKFITFDSYGNKIIVTLTNAYMESKLCRVYSPVTEKTLNYFSEDMLSMPGGILGLFNIFEYDKDSLKYDEKKKLVDINKYGLLSLDDYNGLIDEHIFDIFNGKYLGISIAKGLLSKEKIEELVKRYGPLCN